MDTLFGEKIANANLTDWRKLAQGMHARFLVDDFAQAARFVTAIAEATAGSGHVPEVSIVPGAVDLKLVSDDAVYRDGDVEHVVAWVTQDDLDTARRISELAAAEGLEADPQSVAMIELGLDAGDSALVAPVWAALLTGLASAQGHGSPSDEVRDPLGRIPNLWFGDTPDESSRQRFHVEVYVAPDVVDEHIAAAVAAGGTVVDDSQSPGLTVIADQEGNRGVVCADVESFAATS